MMNDDNWKARTLLIGALTGLGAAYLIVRRAEASETRPRLTAGLGVQLGMLLLGLLRQVGRLGEGEG